MGNRDFYFLNYNLGVKRTGIESSSLLRSKLFFNQLNILPIFITYLYKSQLATEIDILKTQKKMPIESIAFSLYDYLQQFPDSDPFESEFHVCGEIVHFKGIKNIIHRDSEDKIKIQIIYNKLNEKLHYVNYYSQGVKRRRDYYHESGNLSCSQFLGCDVLNRIEREVFYRYDQKICLMKEYFYNNENKRINVQYQIYDGSGNFSGFLNSDEEFVFYVLDQYFNNKMIKIESVFPRPSSKSVLLVDKNKFFYNPVTYLKKKSAKGRFKVISAIHNLHVANYAKKESGRFNINYSDVFNDLSIVDAVVVLTNIQKNEIKERLGRNAPIYSIPHTYDLAKLDQKVIERESKKAVMFSRYEHDKKHEYAIQAFSKVVAKISDAELHCYGNGSRLKELNDLVVELKMSNNIFLHSWSDNVAEEYEKSTLSIFTSPSEAFPISAMESLAHGCPVVGFDVPYGLKELIQSDENGYLIPFGDIDGMAERIIIMMSDPVLIEDLSKKARLSSERYSEAVVKEIWYQLFKNINSVD